MNNTFSYIPYKGKGKNANIMVIMGIILFCVSIYMLYATLKAETVNTTNLVLIIVLMVFIGIALIKNILKNMRLERGLIYVKLMTAGNNFSFEWLAERTHKSYDYIFKDFQYLISRRHFPGSTIDVRKGAFVPPDGYVPAKKAKDDRVKTVAVATDDAAKKPKMYKKKK